MGRPINKKFFGNTNTGGNRTGTGGEGVASVVLNAKGSYTTQPTFTFSAPQLPGGVTATGTITSEANTVAPDGTLLNGRNYVVGDLITFAGIDGVVGRVATVGGGQGEIQAIDFTGTGTNRSSFTALPTNKTTLAVTVVGKTTGGSGSTGTNQTVAITFRAKEVVITQSGSGYTSAPTSTPTQSVTFTSVALTSARQNALDFLAWAPTASNGTVNSGGSAVGGDIVKQQGTKRYYVKTAQGYGVCSLVATTPAIGQMTLEATDANSNTYYVTRLESKKARLTRKTQSGSNAWVYATNDLAKWTLTAANGTNKALVTTTVQIANV